MNRRNITGSIPAEIDVDGETLDCMVDYTIIPGRPAMYGQPEEFTYAELTGVVADDGSPIPHDWEPDDALLARCMEDALAAMGDAE